METNDADIVHGAPESILLVSADCHAVRISPEDGIVHSDGAPNDMFERERVVPSTENLAVRMRDVDGFVAKDRADSVDENANADYVPAPILMHYDNFS